MPLVSICLPVLNGMEFLESRIDCILNQTLADWELIISDNYSVDGTWEYLQNRLGKDSRVKFFRYPCRGMYDNWNNCIRNCSGKYIYIATADDTMDPECLGKMANCLEQDLECDLCNCKLQIIDENGSPHKSIIWDNFGKTRCFGRFIDLPHIRYAPHDGLLHCAVQTVYTSITSLLIRKSLFDKIGLFLCEYGSIADFEWGMRASLVANTCHIPEYLATWRQHVNQATDAKKCESSETYKFLSELVEKAFNKACTLNSSLKKYPLSSLQTNMLWNYLASLWMEKSGKFHRLRACIYVFVRNRKLLFSFLNSESKAKRVGLKAFVAFMKDISLPPSIALISEGKKNRYSLV